MSICDTNMIKEESSKDKDKYCDYNNFKRARYFHGMLMTDRDFREEQIYHNGKRKLLNRMLHGWGVVCGLGIKATHPESSKIIITPGMALDCKGNEILVCEDFELDLKQADICPDTSKNPCAEKEKECKYYIAIKYNEVSTDPVAVYAPGGGCEEKVCDYSRIREGFCVKLLKELPCYSMLPKKGLIEEVSECLKAEADKQKNGTVDCINEKLNAFCETLYPCPECCCKGEPYVVLGSITFEDNNCVITSISQGMISISDERRYIITSMFWQYYLASLYPPIATFLDNPFNFLCHILYRVVPPPKGKEVLLPQMARQFPFSMPKITADTLEKITAVGNMAERDAKKILTKQKVSYNQTITLSPDRAIDILMRAIATEKIEPAMRVDLVIDDETKKVLFYIPASTVPAKEDFKELTDRLQQSETTIDKLNEIIDNHKEIIDNLFKTSVELEKRIAKLERK